mgnify:CR=1 FL=1
MSVTLAPSDIVVTAYRAGLTSTLRLRGALEVRQAATARAAVRDFLDSPELAAHLIVDLSAVEALDAAGLAAITSPVLKACRVGRPVSVVPPMAARPRRLADQVGVLPIGSC